MIARLLLLALCLCPAPARAASPACRANVGGPYALTYSGTRHDGVAFSALGVLVIDAGTFRLKANYTFRGGGRWWFDHDGLWAWVNDYALDVGSGCEMILGPVGDLPAIVALVSPNGRFLTFTTGAAAGTAIRQAWTP
jgi:hypothetical protein